nr:hypothetical protein [Tanacetum cinerariifolium]
MKKIIKEQVKEQVKVQVSKSLLRIKQAVNEQLEAKVLTRSSYSSRTSYVVAADLSEIELKKILIEKMEGNKPDRGSKRRREGKEPKLANALMETATRSAGRSTQRSRSRQASTSESALAEEPMQTTSQIEEPSHSEFDTELLAGPTYELMKGSCKSLIELEYHLEEVYKATTDQLDWVNLEGQHEIVTIWFTLITLSALRRYDNENMLSLTNLYLGNIKIEVKDDDDAEEDAGDDGEEGNGDDDDDENDDGDEGEEGDDDNVDQEVVRDGYKDDEEEGGDEEHEFDEDESDEETRDEESFDHIP